MTGTRQGLCDTLAVSPLTGRLQALSKKTTRMAVEKLPWSYKQTQTLTRCPQQQETQTGLGEASSCLKSQPLPSRLAIPSLTT